MRTDAEVDNLVQRVDDPDAAWAVAELLGNIPLEVAGDVWSAMTAGLSDAGYDSFFRVQTGFRVLFVRRRL